MIDGFSELRDEMDSQERRRRELIAAVTAEIKKPDSELRRAIVRIVLDEILDERKAKAGM